MYGVKTSVDHPSWLVAELGSSYASRQMHVIHLANTPTPVQRLRLIEPLLPARDLNMELWIKRDDFTGSELSGNKVRKLEFILADAVEQGCDTVVTIGGIQSNHCRATVAAANSLGLEAHVVLRTSRLAVDQDPGATGNLLVSRLANAHVHLVSKEEYARHGQKELGRRVVEELRAAGKKPYLIVVGGSSALGTFGYTSMIDELDRQLDHEKVGVFDRIVVACGSGGTVAGIALGLWACPRFREHGTRLEAMMVSDNEAYFTEYVVDLYKELGMDEERAREVLRSTTTFTQAKGAGYAISREEELDTVLELASQTSICLDPTYTGKAFHYWLDTVRGREEYRDTKVLFVHTGGLGSIYGNEVLEKRLVEGREGRGTWSRLRVA